VTAQQKGGKGGVDRVGRGPASKEKITRIKSVGDRGRAQDGTQEKRGRGKKKRKRCENRVPRGAVARKSQHERGIFTVEKRGICQHQRTEWLNRRKAVGGGAQKKVEPEKREAVGRGGV